METNASLPRALTDFLGLYRAGRFFAAHEALEIAWLQTHSPFYRALIILAAAFCQRDRGNAVGTARNLRKALARLEGCPAAYLGLDVEGIRTGIVRRLTALAQAGIDPDRAGGDGGPNRLPLRNLVPDLPLPVRPDSVRGDEPEWREGAG